MMISMPRAPQEGVEPCLGFALQLAKKRRRPVVVGLLCDGREHGFDRVVEVAEQLGFRFAGAAKFQWALPDVPRPADLGSNVVVEVSGEMKNQVADAVAVRMGLRPELFE